jgi:ribokinase
MSKIVILGDYNIDLVLYLDRLPQPSERVIANTFFEGPGGKGSNQAIAASRMGGEVWLISAIGRDHYGQLAMDAWKVAGVHTDYVIEIDQVSSAIATIFTDSDSNKMIAINPGANTLLTPDHLETCADIIKSADVLMASLGVPLDVVEKALKLARAAGTTTILNPAPAEPISSEILMEADHIILNEGELEIIAQAGASSVTPESARHIFQRDDQTLIVTQGDHGATWVTMTDMATEPAFEAAVKDTIGAGDAFNAAFAVAIAAGRPLSEAVLFANAAASLSVQRVGAVAGLPHRDEVDALMTES